MTVILQSDYLRVGTDWLKWGHVQPLWNKLHEDKPVISIAKAKYLILAFN